MFSIQYFLKKILFPEACVVCKKSPDILCNPCLHNLTIVPRIQKIGAYAQLTFFHYADKKIAKIIWELKYKNNRELRKLIIDYLKSSLNQELLYLIPDTQTHVYYISTPKTQRDTVKKRDFDHALLLTQAIQKTLPYPSTLLVDCIHKNTTKRQVEHTTRTERIQHMHNTCSPRDTLKTLGQHTDPLIIIDDVTTTGATRDEMIRVLKKNFTGKIIFIALAH